MMKRHTGASLLLLMGLLLVCVSSGFAQGAMESTDPHIDGKVWTQSTDSDKRAFLLGVSNAVVLEYHLRQKRSEEPSRFIKGWVAAFKESKWSEMVSRVDAYYASNPDKLRRNVLDVVWHEMITPRWKE
jgi:hypothetical protein